MPTDSAEICAVARSCLSCCTPSTSPGYSRAPKQQRDLQHHVSSEAFFRHNSITTQLVHSSISIAHRITTTTHVKAVDTMVWKAVLRGMPTGPNVHGVPPPERCTVWGVDGEALQVATGDIRKAPFERSLLIASRDFDQLIATTVCQSGTLKAWFAYRVSTRHPGEKKLKSAHFAPVWAMIQESAADWAEQYDRCSDRAEMWELGQPTSILELQARVLYVLYRQVQDNPDGDLQRGLWLKWHPYYYEDVGKYLVLHRFLQYLVKHTGEGRSMDIYRRPSLGVQEHMRRAPFEETYGYQVHQMSQMFIESMFNPQLLEADSVTNRANICQTMPGTLKA